MQQDNNFLFRQFPKIPRWQNEKYVFTEKIDGTNGCIIITEYGDIFAQSRTRILDESSSGDNYGFCKWVMGNKDDLMKLGPGYHYGEWWGKGIQRNYGIKERRFSLFNIWKKGGPDCCYRVPVVENNFEKSWERLKEIGSIAAPGFLQPEGFVMSSQGYHGVLYKVLFDKKNKKSN